MTGRALAWIALAIAVVALAIMAGWWWWRDRKAAEMAAMTPEQRIAAKLAEDPNWQPGKDTPQGVTQYHQEEGGGFHANKAV